MFTHPNKSKSPVEKPPYSAHLTMNILTSAFSTFFAHPFRVLLNEASVNTNPLMTIQSATNKIFHDAHINIIRGTASTGLQSIVKHYANQCYGKDTHKARLAGVFGTAFAGITVTPIEIIFMRKSALRSTSTAIDACKSLQRPPLLKYNLPTLTFFGLRELGFTSSIFGTDDLPFYQRLPFLLPSAVVTAITHKLASVEITKDIRGIAHLVPDYKIGFSAVFRNIAYGNIYQHDSFRVPVANPRSMSQLAINFLSATCGANMFFWRLAYLSVFASLLSFANQEIGRLYTQQDESYKQKTKPASPRMK